MTDELIQWLKDLYNKIFITPEETKYPEEKREPLTEEIAKAEEEAPPIEQPPEPVKKEETLPTTKEERLATTKARKLEYL